MQHATNLYFDMHNAFAHLNHMRRQSPGLANYVYRFDFDALFSHLFAGQPKGTIHVFDAEARPQERFRSAVQQRLLDRPDVVCHFVPQGTTRGDKGVDPAMAMQILRDSTSNLFDHAVIISGDADFIGAAECMLAERKGVTIAAFRAAMSNQWHRVAVVRAHLDGIPFVAWRPHSQRDATTGAIAAS